MRQGKKFIFASLSVVCVSLVTWRLNYAGEVYLKLIGSICGLFIIGQSYVDSKHKT